MTTDEALSICECELYQVCEHFLQILMAQVCEHILMGIETDGVNYSNCLNMGKAIETIFLENYDILDKDDYPDFEEVAARFIASYDVTF